MELRDSWEHVYISKGDAELSWFQSTPEVSLSLIRSLVPQPRRVIDIGGGQSALVRTLLSLTPVQASVLDISPAAIRRAQERFGPAATSVRWLVADVLSAEDLDPVDLWHDRAMFHFLTRLEDRRQYAAIAAKTVVEQGHAIIATFAPTGPDKCSGLPTCRFDALSLSQQFAPWFELVCSTAERHTTPWQRNQDFTYVVLKRTDLAQEI